MAVVVTADDVKARYEGDLYARYGQEFVQTQVDDAIAFIASFVPAVTRRLASGRLTARAYTRVVCDVVLRVLRNPGGYTSESDGSYSYGVSAAVASGNFLLTPNDLAVLTGSTGGTVGTVGMGVDRGWAR